MTRNIKLHSVNVFQCEECDTHAYTDLRAPKGWLQDEETGLWFCCPEHYGDWQERVDTLPPPGGDLDPVEAENTSRNQPSIIDHDMITQPDIPPLKKEPK